MASSPREQASAARWLDRVIAMLYVGTLGWVVWHFGGAAARPMALGFALAMAAVGLVWCRWWAVEPTGLPTGWWWPLPMLAYAGWHALSLSATPGRAMMETLHGAWGLAGYWIALHLVRLKEPRRWLFAGVGVLTLLLAGVAFYQRAVDAAWLPMGRTQAPQYLERSAGLLGSPNTLAAWLLLVIPPAWWLLGRNIRQRPRVALAAGVIAVAASATMVLTLSRGGWIALVLALVGWVIGGGRIPWFGRIGIGLGLIVLFVGGVSLAYHHSPPLRERVDAMIESRGERMRPAMWSIAWQLWQDSPWIGTGGGSYEALLDRHRPMGFRDSPTWAHNDYLNLLSDYGVIGFSLSWGVLVAGAGIVIWRRRETGAAARPGNGTRSWRIALLVGLGGLGLATAVDFHLRLPAILWLAGLILAEWLVGRQRGAPPPHGRDRGRGRRAVVPGAVGLAVLWLAGFAWPRYHAEALRFHGRELTNRLARTGPESPGQADLEPIREAFVKSTRLAPEHEKGWAELSMVQALYAHAEPDRSVEIGQEAEQSARRALALCDEDPMNWVRLGVALDLQGEWAQGGLAFGKAIRIAPTNARVWYYQAFHFSQKPHAHALARAALATCLRLDGRIMQAKALQAALERSR